MWDKSGEPPVKRLNRSTDNRGDREMDSRRFFGEHKGQQPKRPDNDKAANTSGPSGWQIAQQILIHHEPESASVTNGDWMAKLKEESERFLDQQRGGSLEKGNQESIYKKGIEILVDKIFALLQRYMYEFNKVAAGTDLHVSGTISGDVTEVTRFNKLREAEETATYFRARFSTKYFSLILRGKDDFVDFYLLPVNRAMALSKSESEYKAIATLQVKITEEGMMWRLRDGVPAVDSLENLSIWLFQQLVNQTKAASVASARSLS